MHYEIYIDVVFCINFVMDYIILSITDGILKCTNRTRPAVRLLKRYAAAAAGALWVCVVLVFRLYGLVWNVITYIPVCAMMIIIMADIRKPSVILKGVGVMYLAACMFGGFIHILYYYTMFGYMVSRPDNGLYTASIWHIAAGTVLFTPALKIAYTRISAGFKIRRFVYEIEIEHGGRKISLKALCDTGNSLTDPYNGEPVNIICSDCLDMIIGDMTGCGYHLVPYKAVGTDDGLIPVIRLDRLILHDGQKIKVIDKPLFALYSGKFAGQEEYRAIVHPALMGGTKG